MPTNTPNYSFKLPDLFGDDDQWGAYLNDNWTSLDTILATTGTGDLKADGSVPLTANWDVGPFKIVAEQLESDIATGQPPFIVASSSLVTNLNADLLDGFEGSDYVQHTETNLYTDADKEKVDNYIPQNGFVDRADSDISFVDGTRTFTISPAVTSYDFWSDGSVFTKSGSDNAVIPDTEGLHYIYFDETGTLVTTTTFSEDIITTYAFVCAIYWDATNNEAVMVMEERHGYEMDSATHVYNHNTLGARFGSGFALGDMDVDGNGNDASAAQFSVANGELWDEDIHHIVTNAGPQDLAPTASIPMLYRDGAAGDWRKASATDYPITTAGTGRAAWNEFTGATWQLTEVGSNNFVLVHYYATGDINEPVVGIVGANEYGTLSLAQAGAVTEIRNLNLGVLDTLTPEFVPLATVIWQTAASYANAVKSRVRSTEEGADYVDWRYTSASGASSGTTSVEGTDILSTGEVGGTKFLREDGDGTCSWQAVAGGSGGDLLADGSVPLTANWNMGDFDLSPGGLVLQDGFVIRNVSSDDMIISGGASTTAGGNIKLWGDTNPGNPSGVDIHTGTTKQIGISPFGIVDILNGPLQVDTINEHTSAAGVTIDGVVLKDSEINPAGQTTTISGKFAVDSTGVGIIGDTLLYEQADHVNGITPGQGLLWVRNDTPNTLIFTDDAGTDHDLTAGGGGGGDLLADGSVPLTANWDVGAFKITALQLESDATTGTAPLVVASTTLVANLNADLLDGNQASAFATSAQGATADTAVQPGSVNHDGFADYVATEHIDWTLDVVQTVHVDNIQTFGTSQAGKVPASGGGTTNFLRADGTWAAPAGGGGDAWSDPVDSDIVPDGVTDRALGSSVEPFGNLHVKNITSHSSLTSFVRNTDDSFMGISGGGSVFSGANIFLYGGIESSDANDMHFRSGLAKTMWYDASLTKWIVESTELEVVGQVSVDTIVERSAAAGVTIDGVLLKDSAIDIAAVQTFGTSQAGKVPASGGGTTNFLRADGTWAAPAGGSGGGDLLADGTVPLTADWNVGAFDITAVSFKTGQAVLGSNSLLQNTNADGFILSGGNSSVAGANIQLLGGATGLVSNDMEFRSGNSKTMWYDASLTKWIVESAYTFQVESTLQAGELEIEDAPATDETAHGITATMDYGATIAFGNLLRIATDSDLELADADAASTMPGVFLALESGVNGGSGKVLCQGFVRDDTWAWTVGGKIYASTTAGGLTQTAPSGTGDQIQVVGIATHADRIWFNPSLDTVEHA